jgi:hypothetical protein
VSYLKDCTTTLAKLGAGHFGPIDPEGIQEDSVLRLLSGIRFPFAVAALGQEGIDTKVGGATGSFFKPPGCQQLKTTISPHVKTT